MPIQCPARLAAAFEEFALCHPHRWRLQLCADPFRTAPGELPTIGGGGPRTARIRISRHERENIREVFEISGFLAVLDITTGRNEALARLTTS